MLLAACCVLAAAWPLACAPPDSLIPPPPHRWTASFTPVSFFFYSVFTSHVEVTLNLCCDTVVAALLLQEWLWNIGHDFRLRLDLNRLRCGSFKIAPRHPRPDRPKPKLQ